MLNTGILIVVQNSRTFLNCALQYHPSHAVFVYYNYNKHLGNMFNTLKLHMEECLCMTMKCNAQAQHASDLTIRCQWQSQGDAWTSSPSLVLHDIPLNYLNLANSMAGHLSGHCFISLSESMSFFSTSCWP